MGPTREHARQAQRHRATRPGSPTRRRPHETPTDERKMTLSITSTHALTKLRSALGPGRRAVCDDTRVSSPSLPPAPVPAPSLPFCAALIRPAAFEGPLSCTVLRHRVCPYDKLLLNTLFHTNSSFCQNVSRFHFLLRRISIGLLRVFMTHLGFLLRFHPAAQKSRFPRPRYMPTTWEVASCFTICIAYWN